MIRSRLTEYISHPVAISVIPWLIAVFIIPDFFSRYLVKHVKDDHSEPNILLYYRDLDNDGVSEKISFDLHDAKQTKIMFLKENRVMAQYNLKFQPGSSNFIHFGDFNSDNCLECYVFTMNQDSVFLNIIDPVILRKTVLSDRFIDFRRRAPNSTDAPSLRITGLADTDLKDNKELCFFISTGFSLQPRKAYYYDIDNDMLVRSPESGAVITYSRISDINRDKLPEFLLNVNAPGNTSDDFPFTDMYTWLMVLDNRLDFLFAPARICKNPSALYVLPLTFGEETFLAALNEYFGTDTLNSSFYLFDDKGKLLSSKPAPDFEAPYASLFPNPDDPETFFFLNNISGNFAEMDSSFTEVRTGKIPETRLDVRVETDADMDGRKELVFTGADLASIIIVQNNFRYPVKWVFTENKFESPVISNVLTKQSRPMLYLQFSDHGSYIIFRKNNFYFLKYPFYISVYLMLLLFVWGLERIQRYRAGLKLETERRIAHLQMRAIRNQADPHFTLNILNAIGSLYSSEKDRDKADYIFGKYARLIRQTVISSDQIVVPLCDELEFVKNYLDIEKFRRNDSFTYSIDVGNEINDQIKIPRMLIHTFVENALKYGIEKRGAGGSIKISVFQGEGTYRVAIEDNGPGIRQGEQDESGTGKGLVILKEMIELYRKLEKVTIGFTLENISDDNGTISGFKATVTIPIKNQV